MSFYTIIETDHIEILNINFILKIDSSFIFLAYLLKFIGRKT